MSIRNKIGSQGFVSERSAESSDSLVVEQFANSGSNILYADSVGTVRPSTIASRTRFQYVEHSVEVQSVTGSFININIDGGLYFIDGGLSIWSTSSNRFQFENLNDVYTIQFEGRATTAAANPTLHLDLLLSGADPTADDTSLRHHQSIETVVSNTADHTHIHAVFNIFADADYLASGAILTAESTGGQIDITSASVMIKEG